MLAIDVGNTFTRIAAFSGAAIEELRSIPTKNIQPAAVEDALRELAPLAAGGGVWVASVVPHVNAAVDSSAEKMGMRRRFINSGLDAIIPHRLKTPQTTGVDRLLSAMAAGELWFWGESRRNGYVIVQCGSAATVDIVDASGCFCGGYILPGPALWLNGIAGAAQLPNLASRLPDWDAISVGDNTQDAILHGMSVALPAAVASAAMIIHANREKSGDGGNESLPVAITGGWGEAVTRMMKAPFVYDKDLLLHGIRIFAERTGQVG